VRVVIVGSYSLSEMEVEPLVTSILSTMVDKYTKLRIIATDCDRGVGKLIKNSCLPPEPRGGKPRFCLEEMALRIYSTGPELTSAERAALLKPRNAYLAEVGEEFHIIFGTEGVHGMMGDLYHRLMDQYGALVATYTSTDTEIKEPKKFSSPK
jgi:hypothetical protein